MRGGKKPFVVEVTSKAAFGLDVPIPTWAWQARDAPSTRLRAKSIFVGFIAYNGVVVCLLFNCSLP
jgi:hypothetical protein